ncbi:MAG: DUF362 domain-containing protein [Desulfobacterales bacterium]|nr:MAG: DUF362 domain-containing protein [Desulfobacterales bacterium]
MSVALVKWQGPETVAQALEAIDAWETFRPGMNVLIKPNVVMAGSPKIASAGITTSPVIVGEIIRLTREMGAGSVVIAEGSVELPTLKLDTAAAFQWSGIQALAERENVPLIDMNKGPYRTFTLSDGTEIEIAEAVFTADFVINVPILKTHNQTITTVSLKNLKGCLSMESKKKCHMESDLNRAIAEFNQLIPCHLNVVDALTATEIGPLPSGKADQVRELGLLLAGKDRLSCDVVGSFLLGYPAEKVPHIVHFAQLTAGSLRLEDVSVIGEDPARYRLELAYIHEWLEDIMAKFAVVGMRMPPYGNELCSACGVNLWAGLYRFCKANRGVEIEGGAELCAGLVVAPGKDTQHSVLLGKCAIQKNKGMEGAVKVPGCPPDPAKVAEILTKALIEGVKP